MKRTVIFILLLLAVLFVYRNVSGIMERNHEDDVVITQTAEAEAVKAGYELVIARVSWEEARTAAEELGGHLAVLRTSEDFERANRLCLAKGLDYCWLGAEADGDGAFTSWVTGEAFDVPDEWWASGQPSSHDLDGTPETYLCYWPLEGGSLNDQRNDITSVIGADKTVGFLVEYSGEE